MIKDKITPALNVRLSTAIKLTMNTGKERSFFICKDRNGKLLPGRTYFREIPNVKDYENACPTGGIIKGNFHTKSFINELREEIRSKFGYIPSSGEKRTDAISNIIRRHKKHHKIERIKGPSILNIPSYDQVLYTIVAKCSGTDNDTMCIGNDLDTENILCWTVDRDIKLRDCQKAIDIAKKEKYEKDRYKEKLLDEWMISLFKREKIKLK